MSDFLQVRGGRLYDPQRGIDGQIQDIWACNGKIISPPASPPPAVTTLDATDLIVMPGGVDMHCHIAGSKVNAGRRLRPEEKTLESSIASTRRTRSGAMGSVPTTFATGYRYAGLGYTSAFDAAVAPTTARHTHDEFQDTPCIDKGCYLLLGDHRFAQKCIANAEPQLLRSWIAWQLQACKGYGVKLVNPGGIEVWKRVAKGNLSGLDDRVPPYDLTPRQIIQHFAIAADQLSLPHPIHLHCNQLGMPGNWTTTLDSMKTLEGHRAHLTHIQFHSYAGGDADEATFGSEVAPLADYVNRHPNLSVDVGQVLFGPTTSMTGDGVVGHFLSELYGTKWLNVDVEMEAGCGVAPIEYRRKSLVHAWQWAIGLEWYLLVNDPWCVVMSTDHPNGGSFLAYPQIIRLLMDKNYRQEKLAEVHQEVVKGSVLRDLEREYTLYEIAIITRAGPARLLGLPHKGHLGPGADADITVYTPDANQETMFSHPRWVIKHGEIIIEQGEIRQTPAGRTLHVAPEYDGGILPEVKKWFDEYSSVHFDNYTVDKDTLGPSQQVDCSG